MDDDKPLIIILADDDENDRLNFKDALTELKIKAVVLALNDGIELMNHLSKDDTPLPLILFLDLNMPRKGGLQCLKEIRSIERLKDVVVAVYSTSSSEKDIEESFHSGANVYLKKPADFGDLKNALQKIITYTDIYKDPPFNIANFVFRL